MSDTKGADSDPSTQTGAVDTSHTFPESSTFTSAFRGDITFVNVLRESFRRTRALIAQRRERAMLARSDKLLAPQLLPEFAKLDATSLLEHFRTQLHGRFFPLQEPSDRTHSQSTDLIDQAEEILEGRWSLLGYRAIDFGATVDWLSDPITHSQWPLAYHADVELSRNDRSDIRLVWELNRLGHLLVLARAFRLTNDERYASEILRQVRDWRVANPVGYGPNWVTSMEVALRAINLLCAFVAISRSQSLDHQNLVVMLMTLGEHGAHIRRNLEFSYLTRGNHYLADVAGLFWLGTIVPELAAAKAWREFGLKELLSEMDAQVLPDGVHFESSTGYHRFVTEVFLYSFLLARINQVDPPAASRRLWDTGAPTEGRPYISGQSYWSKLRSMIYYVNAYVRPDGMAPLIGDSDSGQVLPLLRRHGDDHAYLCDLGAVIFAEPSFKRSTIAPAELRLLLGDEGVEKHGSLEMSGLTSTLFPCAGTYVLRDDDLYLLFNWSGTGLHGRGSHAHNDALSIEVSACGVSFIRDPGTYVYTRDLKERHRFRSTAYHSTVEVDGVDQNTTDVRRPFRLGGEARPRGTGFQSFPTHDSIGGEHYGYERLKAGRIVHRRLVNLDKEKRYWLVTDELTGTGAHSFRFIFHMAPGIEVRRASAYVEAKDRITGARLLIKSLDGFDDVTLEQIWSSRDYGEKQESIAVCWTVRSQAPITARWELISRQD